MSPVISQPLISTIASPEVKSAQAVTAVRPSTSSDARACDRSRSHEVSITCFQAFAGFVWQWRIFLFPGLAGDTGHGHSLHQRDLGCSARLVFVPEGGEKVLKTVRGFFFENDGLSEQSVAGAVAGRIAFALIGDGASGSGSVGFRCLNLFIGSHKRIWPQINADERG